MRDPSGIPRPAEYPDQPELALAALLYLMTRFTIRPCARKAEAIIHHLGLVGADDRLPPDLRHAARRMDTIWRAMTARPGTAPGDLLH